MSELETQYASRSVLNQTRETLINKKLELEKKLAELSLQLVEVGQQIDAEPQAVTSVIRMGYYRYHDDGYTVGYITGRPSTEVIVQSRSFVTAYLGALTRSVDAIPNTSNKSDSFSITLGKLSLNKESDPEPTNKTVQNLFDEYSTEAFEIIHTLREHIKENNPYEDIPIKINKNELSDAMLRIEIIKYCKSIDPDFRIYEPDKNS